LKIIQESHQKLSIGPKVSTNGNLRLCSIQRDLRAFEFDLKSNPLLVILTIKNISSQAGVSPESIYKLGLDTQIIKAEYIRWKQNYK